MCANSVHPIIVTILWFYYGEFQIFPKQKDAEFSEDGRPFHPFFYCKNPNYHQALYEVVDKIEDLSLRADRAAARNWSPAEAKLINTPVYLSSTRWMNREELSQVST